ncbi:putative toxin-antitoxin system toxin component, PIN family [Mucilaginibacter sp. HD30]
MVLVLDCNIWVTLTLNKQLELIADLSDEGFILPTCIELRSEIANVLNRPKFSKFISQPDIKKVIELHDLVTKVYKTGKLIKITSDPKDDYLFALALKAKAHYLVTGDRLLLNVAKYKRTQIITLSQLRELRQES